MAKQADNTGVNWYVLHTYSGYEDAVRDALLQRIESMNMQDYIFEAVVPKIEEITIKRGDKITVKKPLFPGYVLVRMQVTDESWYVARNTPNVTGFVGSGNIPVSVTPEEYGLVQRHVGEADTQFKIDIQAGETVRITEGPFMNYEGQVLEVDKDRGKIKVSVSIFGRETPVELDFVQVKKQ